MHDGFLIFIKVCVLSFLMAIAFYFFIILFGWLSPLMLLIIIGIIIYPELHDKLKKDKLKGDE